MDVETDFLGNNHVDSPDLGAYEYRCIPTLLLNQDYISGTYEAELEIHASGSVPSMTDVIFSAKDSVVLDQLFEVEQNAIFTVDLAGCPF